MIPQSKARQFWVLKDAVGDYIEWEPTRHTASDFIHVIEFEAYRKAVEALKMYGKAAVYNPATDQNESIAYRVIQELGVECE